LLDGERRLAAIMYTDMVGYTALGQKNESLSLTLVDEQRKLIRPILARHHGKEIKTMGDAFLVEFLNATDSVKCAYDIQRATREFNLALASDKRIHLRIGIHLGEVVESQDDISGDAVNVASRIEPLAEDGGVCLTRQVYDHILNKTELRILSIGVKPLKNVSTPMEVYKMEMPWEQPSPSKDVATLPRNRIAVLPFRNMSPDPNDEYFAEGMTEEIISTVSGISGLKVISRTSVMHYRNTEKTVKDIGRELEVGSVLEGSFRKAGNRIRVTTQLISVADDEHLWAQNYDRNLDDVFEVQSDVAKQVADALRVRILSPEMERIERKPTESTIAYSLYLKGRSVWNKRGLEDIKKSREYFELAVHEDPGFALGYVGVADCCMILSTDWGIDRDANVETAKKMVARALELDPGLAEAHTTNGSLFAVQYDLHHAEEEYRKAIELKPNYATAHHWYHLWVLRPLHRWNEAMEQIEKALELDPLSPVLLLNHGTIYFDVRDYARSLGWCKKAVELGLNYARVYLAQVYARLGMYSDMRRELADYVKLAQASDPFAKTVADVDIAYYEADRETVRRLLPELQTAFEKNVTGAYRLDSLMIADFYFFLDEKDRGFEWLERAYSRREPYLTYLTMDRTMDGVRDDPRYLDLVRRLGLD